jgi:uncharacterized protein (DUF2235 family)
MKQCADLLTHIAQMARASRKMFDVEWKTYNKREKRGKEAKKQYTISRP